MKTYAHISDDEDNGLAGDVDHHLQVMRLATHASHDTMAETYLHELMHVVLTKAGLGSVFIGEDIHEDYVNRISPILLHTLRDNPRVVSYLTGRQVGGRNQ